MIERTVTVQNEMGLHARCAGKLVRCAQKFYCRIEAKKNGKTYDLKRMMSIMLMGCTFGELVTLEFDGPDEENAAAAVEQLFASRFDEPV